MITPDANHVCFSDLKQTLEHSVAVGHIGTPVAIRVTLQLPAGRDGFADVVAPFAELANHLFQSPPSRCSAHCTANGAQLTALITHAGGQTTSITVGRGTVAIGELHAVVVGNTGIARLEGGAGFDAEMPLDAEIVETWRTRLHSACESTAAIRLS